MGLFQKEKKSTWGGGGNMNHRPHQAADIYLVCGLGWPSWEYLIKTWPE